MNRTNPFKAHVRELIEYINSFFTGRKTPAEELESFRKTRENSLAKFSEMGDMIEQFPHYVAVAFLGKFQFGDCDHVRSLKKGGDATKLAAIRTAQSVQVAESAREAWQFVLAKSEDKACLILALCYVSEQKSSIKKTLNK